MKSQQPHSTQSQSAPVRRAASSTADASEAIAELARSLEPATAELVVLFLSPRHDRSDLESAISEHFGETRVIGCTTAGEIGPAGYHEDTLSGFALDRAHFSVEVSRLDGLQEIGIDTGQAVMVDTIARMKARGLEATASKCFGFVLVDGLSMREEALVSSLNRPMADIPLFGGSAGDSLAFESTQIFHGDRFHDDAAVVALVHTELPFEVFRTQHFAETPSKMVITEADPRLRTVTEINAEPAAREYAEQVGLQIDELTPQVFAAHPVLVKVGGETFVRSIAKVNADESLSFFCAIEPGNVLTVAKGEDLVGNLESTMNSVRERVGDPLLTIGCDCILRSLEIEREGLRESVAEIFERFHTVGFATYGEQYNAMHVNQTLTGVMIGPPRA